MQRRTFLRTAGIAATAALAGTTPAVAAGDDSGPGMADVGIESRVKSLLRSGRIQAAHALLDRHGVEYSHNSTRFAHVEGDGNGQGGSGGSDDVSTQKIYLNPDKNSSSVMDLGVYPISNSDDHYAFLYLDLAVAGNAGFDGAGPMDGLSISYSDVPYRTLPDTANSSDLVYIRDVNQYGVRADLRDDDLGYNQEFWLDCEIDERYNAGSETTVYSDYVHTWNPGGFPSNWGISFDLIGPGALTVDASGYVEQYRAEHNVTHYI